MMATISGSEPKDKRSTAAKIWGNKQMESIKLSYFNVNTIKKNNVMQKNNSRSSFSVRKNNSLNLQKLIDKNK